MYIDKEIEQLREELSIIEEEKINAENQAVLDELNAMEKEVSSLLISKFYRMVNYSQFDTETLITSLADSISVVEDKNMTPDIVFVSKKIGHSHLEIYYAKLIIREKENIMQVFYDSEEQFEDAIKNKDVLILREALGGISKKIDTFELIKDSLFINQDNMNLNNIKGIRLTIYLGDKEYLKDFIEKLIHYKYQNDKTNISNVEITDFMNEYALEIISNDKQNKKMNKIKEKEGH